MLLLAGVIGRCGNLEGQGCEHLVSYWILDEPSGDNYRDVIGGHDAYAVTSAPDQVEGRVGKAQAFNGTTDYLSIADHPDFDWAGDQSFTIEMWVILDSISISDNMVFIGRDANLGTVHWWVGAEEGTGRAMFVLVASNGAVSTVYGPVMELGSWYHLVAVRDADSNTNKLYINNTITGTGTVDYASGDFASDATIDIGVLNYNGSADRFFAPVVIDELAIYDVALTGSEIGAHFNNGLRGIGYCGQEPPFFLTVPDSLAVVYDPYTYKAIARGMASLNYHLITGPGSIDPSSGTYTWTPASLEQSGSLVTISASNENESVTQSFHIYLAEVAGCPDSLAGYYRLNEVLGTSYRDISGGVPAEALNDPVPVEGRFGGALLFDGQDDGIWVPDVGQFNFPAHSSFSIEFWIRTSGGPRNMVCVGRQGSTLGQETDKLHMWVGIEGGSDSVVFFLRDSSGNEPVPNGMIKGTEVTDNEWHYIVAVRDGDAGVNYLYVDGSQVGESEVFDYPGSFGSFDTAPLDIGYLRRSNGNPSYFFDGALDEVAIYSRALAPAEVLANYEKSLLNEWHCSPGNYAPGFLSVPPSEAYPESDYTYQIRTMDMETAPSGLSLSVQRKPEWLTFTDLGNGTGEMSGIPQEGDIGTDTVMISVTDGMAVVPQRFIIRIQTPDENDEPIITSVPDSSVVVGEAYAYTLVAVDPDGDTLVKSATAIPEFLQFDAMTGRLEGIPDEAHVGEHEVLLSVSDGMEEVLQGYTLTVNPVLTGTGENAVRNLQMYPVPADQYLVLEIDMGWPGGGTISVIDVHGRCLSAHVIRAGQERLELNLSGLPEGMYVLTIQTGPDIFQEPFIILR